MIKIHYFISIFRCCNILKKKMLNKVKILKNKSEKLRKLLAK